MNLLSLQLLLMCSEKHKTQSRLGMVLFRVEQIQYTSKYHFIYSTTTATTTTTINTATTTTVFLHESYWGFTQQPSSRKVIKPAKKLSQEHAFWKTMISPTGLVTCKFATKPVPTKLTYVYGNFLFVDLHKKIFDVSLKYIVLLLVVHIIIIS